MSEEITERINIKQQNKKRKKRIITSLILIILLILACFGGYWLWLNYQGNHLNSEEQEYYNKFIEVDGNIPSNIKTITSSGPQISWFVQNENSYAYFYNSLTESKSSIYYKHNDVEQDLNIPLQDTSNWISSGLYLYQNQLYCVMTTSSNFIDGVNIIKYDETSKSLKSIYSISLDDLIVKDNESELEHKARIYCPVLCDGNFYIFEEFEDINWGAEDVPIIYKRRIVRIDLNGNETIPLEQSSETDSSLSDLEFPEYVSTLCTTMSEDAIYYSSDGMIKSYDIKSNAISTIINYYQKIGIQDDSLADIKSLTYNNGKLYFTNFGYLYSLSPNGTNFETVTDMWSEAGDVGFGTYGPHLLLFDKTLYFPIDYGGQINKMDIETKESKEFTYIESTHPELDQNIFALFIGEDGIYAFVGYSDFDNDSYSGDSYLDLIKISFNGKKQEIIKSGISLI